MINFDWTSSVYNSDLIISVQDLCSLEKKYGPEDDDNEDDDENYFERFLKLVMDV